MRGCDGVIDHSMRRSLFVVLTLVLLVSLGLIALGQPVLASSGEGGGKLVVTGRAEVKADPDTAWFHVAVETRGKTVEEARAANAHAMDNVRERLLTIGAAPSDLATKGFNVHPEWFYNPEDGSRTLTGYRVIHNLEVTVHELQQLGAWLDAAMAQGANRVSGPTFGLKNPQELEAEALSRAVQQAREKAEVIARASGVFLKGISHISEQVALPPGGAVRAAFATMDAAESVATSISPGEISVTATVSMTFEI